jgi:hypothetical protein
MLNVHSSTELNNAQVWEKHHKYAKQKCKLSLAKTWI